MECFSKTHNNNKRSESAKKYNNIGGAGVKFIKKIREKHFIEA